MAVLIWCLLSVQEYKKLEALLAEPSGLSAEERKEKQEGLRKAADFMRRYECAAVLVLAGMHCQA